MIKTEKTGPNSDNKSATASCSTSEVGDALSAIAGGAMLEGSTAGVAIVETRPAGGVPGQVPTGWMASAVEINPNTGNWTLTVYAVCAKVS